ncbi:N-formylglutamate amidohydrolase [Paraglaciecola psychrophila]|uniref:N-formylglutamate amidohydrolase n=1 Tax=Paraglaciecola psychrophila 170 TaxID=1129794 RepID=K6Z3F5_9ALTE|nr:N-formylglutamate amidohydrolase [Paraglaciecola psychrophila]AGH43546.1 N-formylglutamate amidohydrolase [Paraglaciecola psychrophila 170]GAC39594.1 hypothetical protein GPSY_3983 [Paraglaciecola psychrophila 170]
MSFEKFVSDLKHNAFDNKGSPLGYIVETEIYTMFSPLEAIELPLILDSPHSGMNWPTSVRTVATDTQLKSGWDAHVDRLWHSVVGMGGHLLCAHYSRMFIDLNRAPEDIDPQLLDYLDETCRPTKYSDRGMGLLRKFALPGTLMYDYKLNHIDVMNRLNHYYLPYHNALRIKLDALHSKYGGVWHIDCHSMKSIANKMNIDCGAPRPDVVIGDNDGAAADPAFVDVVEDAFRKLGYKVARNAPYKGGYLVTQYAVPSSNRHSIQIELNRALYMDEKTFEPNSNFNNIQGDLATVTLMIAKFIRSQVA